MAGRPVDDRVLDALKLCCEKWGVTKVTIDDVVAESGVSRATIYRLFPGGKEVIHEALRVRELEEFFGRLRAEVADVDTLEDLLVRSVAAATRELRGDEHLAAMLATEPGSVLGELTVEGFPRIVRMATLTLTPLATPYLSVPAARRVIDVLARLTISYFLAPHDTVDLADEACAREFLRPMIRVLVGPEPPVPA